MSCWCSGDLMNFIVTNRFRFALKLRRSAILKRTAMMKRMKRSIVVCLLQFSFFNVLSFQCKFQIKFHLEVAVTSRPVGAVGKTMAMQSYLGHVILDQLLRRRPVRIWTTLTRQRWRMLRVSLLESSGIFNMSVNFNIIFRLLYVRQHESACQR